MTLGFLAVIAHLDCENRCAVVVAIGDSSEIGHAEMHTLIGQGYGLVDCGGEALGFPGMAYGRFPVYADFHAGFMTGRRILIARPRYRRGGCARAEEMVPSDPDGNPQEARAAIRRVPGGR